MSMRRGKRVKAVEAWAAIDRDYTPPKILIHELFTSNRRAIPWFPSDLIRVRITPIRPKRRRGK